ncbi:MAG: isoprenylcysteine carboxylmethyltransferase family protein [Candidatus Omnitrophica bacterium]|nr:isoprenylcysteine carboxylmethyltransferase family protein [Candidatus Omnitrophota bacterium]MDD5352772.1 isoprenylcysteine carboxylmethyltransferase family protein [Candidatus Omnitrophota bacterium]MDD5550371.1 isoprenylcysteine carboxylmethyltransferase family protein [Candidatus Omnitrophota bacterium]
MNIKDRMRRILKLRFAILYPFGLFIVLFATPDDESIRFGIWFILTGLFIRVWANGYAIKMEKLTTSGPYAFVRHPLYLGTMFVIAGFIIMLKIYLVGVMFIILMAIIYRRTIKKEEDMLEKKFGELYINYKRKIAAMIPAFLPYQEGEKWPFSFRRLIHSQEYKLFIWVIVMVIAFHLKSEFLAEREIIDAKILTLIIVAFLLGSVDLLGEFIKFRIRRKKDV